MNRYIHILATFAILTTITLTAGCATTGRDLVRDNTVKIEKVSSSRATVSFVSVLQEGNDVTLRGEVRRRPVVGRGSIPGHIDLEVIGPHGGILEETIVGYHRRSVKSRRASFRATLQTAPPLGSTIRVTHDTHPLFSCERRHCKGVL